MCSTRSRLDRAVAPAFRRAGGGRDWPRRGRCVRARSKLRCAWHEHTLQGVLKSVNPRHPSRGDPRGRALNCQRSNARGFEVEPIGTRFGDFREVLTLARIFQTRVGRADWCRFVRGVKYSGWPRRPSVASGSPRTCWRVHQMNGTRAFVRDLYSAYPGRCLVSNFSSCRAFTQKPKQQSSRATKPLTWPTRMAVPRIITKIPE